MLDYLRTQQLTQSFFTGPSSLARFLVKHAQPVSSTEELSELASKNPSSVRWPVVVHWDNGLVAIEREDEVNNILECVNQDVQPFVAYLTYFVYPE